MEVSRRLSRSQLVYKQRAAAAHLLAHLLAQNYCLDSTTHSGSRPRHGLLLSLTLASVSVSMLRKDTFSPGCRLQAASPRGAGRCV